MPSLFYVKLVSENFNEFHLKSCSGFSMYLSIGFLVLCCMVKINYIIYLHMVIEFTDTMQYEGNFIFFYQAALM